MQPETDTEILLPRKRGRVCFKAKPSLFAAKNILLAGLASAAYLILSLLLVGFKADQLVLVGLFNACYFASHTSRRFILGFSVFIVYWIIFDYMKAFPNYRFSEVHIESLYQAEKNLFGIHWNNAVLTPNEYLALHTNTFLDVLTGLFYLCWIPVPLLFAGFLFFKNRNAFFQFALTFFLVNLIGFIGYYTYPAAPPWYVEQHGFAFHPATPGNTAGFDRFDAFFGISVFKGMYAKSSNVFAAMPSMHAAFLMIVLFFAVKQELKGWAILSATVMVGIWFSAVYSGHHYLLDVLAGIVCAALGIALFQYWVKTKMGQHALRYLIGITTK